MPEPRSGHLSDAGGPRLTAFLVTPIRLYREGLARFLDSAGIDVIGTAEDASATVALAGHRHPQVILLDMAGAESRITARRLRARFPSTVIVAIGVPEEDDYVIACVESGITGYVSRSESLEDLVAALRSAARGEARCSPRIAAGVFRRLAAVTATSAPTNQGHDRSQRPLTAREVEVVALIRDGFSNKQIAGALCIEVPTVKNHVHAILDKLGVTSRAEAAAHLAGAQRVSA